MSEAATHYNVRLTLSTEYESASDKVRLLTHLFPRNLPDRQAVTSRLLTVSPRPNEKREFTDFFENTATMIGFHSAVEGVELQLRARVACATAVQELDLSPGLNGLRHEIQAHRSLSPSAPHHYTGPSAHVPDTPEIGRFADALRENSRTVLHMVEMLGDALHAEMTFESGATEVDTPIAEAFQRRAGVCQDMSHIMICGLRALGIPAGYVSGFLRTEPPPGQTRLEGADAMHAWVRAWCGAELGWVEFDPTNNCRAGSDHIMVAYGRDYADVAPIQGVMMTSGLQTSHHTVDVIPV